MSVSLPDEAQMFRRLLPIAAFAALAAGFSMPSGAINLFAVGTMPIRYMTDEDRQILHDAAMRSLEQGSDGESSVWENTKTGARGELTPLSTFDQAGRKCRDLEVANSAGGHSNRLVLTACRQEDGDWKVEAR